ncbi:MAG: permease [Planctomycetes bacterium]|nr:permease [Planctomycetota bacterium]
MERREILKLVGLVTVFLALYLLPVDGEGVRAAVGEGLALGRWYAREHVILCLLPAFLIAGAIGAFVDRAAVMKYLGPKARKVQAYGVGATSGSVLAVCSCTILPLFAGIYRMGAGLGPASSFLYAGPAINVLAVILTARILGAEIGFARAIAAVVFSLVVGLVMAAIFERGADRDDERRAAVMPDLGEARPLRPLILLFLSMFGVLIFANWSSSTEAGGLWRALVGAKWWLASGFALAFAFVLWRWFAFPAAGLVVAGFAVALVARLLPVGPNPPFALGVVALCLLMPRAGSAGREWWSQTWSHAKLITPLLLGGVFVAGLLLGRPGERGLIPPEWVASAVGGNGLGANFGAALVGAFMYFATLTEVPILQGLIGAGMGKGPSLSLLLAGPALSLPNMIVINGIMGPRRTATYVALVVLGSTALGLVYGLFF